MQSLKNCPSSSTSIKRPFPRLLTSVEWLPLQQFLVDHLQQAPEGGRKLSFNCSALSVTHQPPPPQEQDCAIFTTREGREKGGREKERYYSSWKLKMKSNFTTPMGQTGANGMGKDQQGNQKNAHSGATHVLRMSNPFRNGHSFHSRVKGLHRKGEAYCLYDW